MRSKLTVLLLLLAFVLSTSACNLVITPPPPAERNPNSMIFTAEQSEEFLPWLEPQAEGTWTPSDADVANLEGNLLPFLHTAEHRMWRPEPPIWERVPDYMRQYVGLIENGKQVIYANFFCDAYDMPWREDLVFVSDGGDCFFQVKYDIANGEFYDLNVHGEA